jgi:hypothetical protein
LTEQSQNVYENKGRGQKAPNVGAVREPLYAWRDHV